MAVYNGAPWVADAARSVLAQTLGDLELVVVDDGSTDATCDVLGGVHDPRLRLERRTHEGLTRALNQGLRLARAPLVARLDADDGAVRRALIRYNPMLHSTVTMRRRAVEAVGGYDARFAVAQDYDLWIRLAAGQRLGEFPGGPR